MLLLKNKRITMNIMEDKHKIKEYRYRMNLYKLKLNKFIITSRFNTKTMKENENFRNRNKKIGCIYCSPLPIAKWIPIDSILFVLEMNNDTNKIMGIGMMKNHPMCGNSKRVYENGNYNRYVFIGKHRIDRKQCTEEEDEVLQALDILCFTGHKHMKRMNGLTSFPIEIMYNCLPVIDFIEFFSKMFKKRLLHNNNDKP